MTCFMAYCVDTMPLLARVLASSPLDTSSHGSQTCREPMQLLNSCWQTCCAQHKVCLESNMSRTDTARACPNGSNARQTAHLDNLSGMARLVQQQRVLWHADWLPLLLRPRSLHSASLQSCSRGRRPLRCPKQQGWQQRLL